MQLLFGDVPISAFSLSYITEKGNTFEPLGKNDRSILLFGDSLAKQRPCLVRVLFKGVFFPSILTFFRAPDS